MSFFGELHTVLTVTFCDFYRIFEKNTPKNTTSSKPENIPGLLHFFDIFCNSPGVSTVYFQGLGND